MASIRIKQPKRREAAASQLTPRSQKKRLSAPRQAVPVPDIPNPLAELPPEGGEGLVRRETISNEKKGLGSGGKSVGPGDARDSTGKGPAIASRSASRRPGGGRRNPAQ
jgi:hypothetical protein